MGLSFAGEMITSTQLYMMCLEEFAIETVCV